MTSAVKIVCRWLHTIFKVENSVPTFLRFYLCFESRLLSRIMNCTWSLGKPMCGCLIIRAQTYCIALQELGKPLIPKTMYKVDHSLLAGSFPVPQTWSTLLMSPSSPAVWAVLQPLHWQLSEGCSRKPLPTWRHQNWLESCSFHVESEFSCYLKDSQKLCKKVDWNPGLKSSMTPRVVTAEVGYSWLGHPFRTIKASGPFQGISEVWWHAEGFLCHTYTCFILVWRLDL